MEMYFLLSLLPLVLHDHEWKELQWRNVVVGDIVKVIDQQFFPADLLLLSSRCAMFSVKA